MFHPLKDFMQWSLFLLPKGLFLPLRRRPAVWNPKAVGWPIVLAKASDTDNFFRDGGQAEYVRIPHANGTVMKAPPEIEDKCLVLMADIFPTGFFGAKNAFSRMTPDEISDGTVVVIGCGPVGLCAIIAALEYKPKHLFAVDSVESRLAEAKKLGAEPLNFVTDKEGMFAKVKSVTEGRGADAIIEVVGLSPALRTAYDLIRPWGVISSIGVHSDEVRSLPSANCPKPTGDKLTHSIDPFHRKRRVQVSFSRARRIRQVC